jgi:FkbM family methyltransferase
MNKLAEPWWLFWMKWHAWRRFKGPRYRVFWNFRNFARRTAPGSLVIDCGANVGDVTALFLDRGAIVHAFEPDPDARASLERRFGGNPALHVHPQAVGVDAGRLRLFRRKASAAGDVSGTISSSLIARDIHDQAESVDVEIVDIFAFMAGLGARIDVLKLDVEGSEAAILERLLDLRYDRRIGRIFIETHERFSDAIADSIARSRRRIAELGITNIDLDWE